MGLVAFLLLALGMVLALNVRGREREPPRPPGAPNRGARRATAATTSVLAMIALPLIATSFATCAVACLWVIRTRAGRMRCHPSLLTTRGLPTLQPSTAGTSVWDGQADGGVLRTAPDCVATIVGHRRRASLRGNAISHLSERP